MSSPPAQNLSTEERLAALEARIADLELRLDAEIPPWHVLAVAVAAVLPHSRLVAAGPVPDDNSSPVVYQNLWCVGGRLELFRSHRLR